MLPNVMCEIRPTGALAAEAIGAYAPMEVRRVQHPAFNNPPIVEAVAALRFAGAADWTDEQRAAIRTTLREAYSGEERQEFQFEVETRFEGPEATTTTKTPVPKRLLFPTEDGTGLVGLGAGVVSVHVLRPYPGWTAFQARVNHVADVVFSATGASGLTEVAVRYVDRIALPVGEPLALDEYFTAIPRRPNGMPGSLTTFQSIIESHDKETNTVAVLTTAAAPPGPGEGFVMLYDLNLIRLFPEDAPLAAEDRDAVLNALHDQQYGIFLDSITDRTKELFK